MSTRDDEELAALLDDLETTLSTLRSELESERHGDRRGPRPPRPPSMRDLLRFTEEYTIPAVIALLEANVRALKTTQRVLRMADPERAARAESSAARDRLDAAGRGALDQLERSLTDLSTALSEVDLPSDPESRDIAAEARDLTAEIEARVADARERRERRDRDGSERGGADRGDSGRDRRRTDERAAEGRADRRTATGSVVIDVTEEGDEPSDGAAGHGDGADPAGATDDGTAGDGATDGTDEGAADAGSVDETVESELRSIKEEMDEPQDGDDQQGA
jgi:hypothetical protein